jgi:hypothetical protein
MTNVLPPAKQSQSLSASNFFGRAKALVMRLRWLSPTASLDDTTSTEFGRNIERQLSSLILDQKVTLLKLRRRDTAVVMSIDHYKEVLEMKETLTQLLKTESRRVISDAANDFEALYSRIISPSSSKAASELFAVNSESLRENYQPGNTETSK